MEIIRQNLYKLDETKQHKHAHKIISDTLKDYEQAILITYRILYYITILNHQEVIPCVQKRKISIKDYSILYPIQLQVKFCLKECFVNYNKISVNI